MMDEKRIKPDLFTERGKRSFREAARAGVGGIRRFTGSINRYFELLCYLSPHCRKIAVSLRQTRRSSRFGLAEDQQGFHSNAILPAGFSFIESAANTWISLFALPSAIDEKTTVRIGYIAGERGQYGSCSEIHGVLRKFAVAIVRVQQK
jgi:hypothetical protein